MKRLAMIGTAAALGLVVAAGAAQAQTTQNASVSAAAQYNQYDKIGWVVDGLHKIGYEVQSIKTTFLGRIRVVAENGKYRREVIVSRTTGEIRSDRIIKVLTADDSDTGNAATADIETASSGGGTSGGTADSGGTSASGSTSGSGSTSTSTGVSVSGGGVSVSVGGISVSTGGITGSLGLGR